MKVIKYISVLAVSAFIFNSCTKDVAGPAGPQGAQGAQGSTPGLYVKIDSAASTAAAWPQDNSAPGGVTEFNFSITGVTGLTYANTDAVDVYFSNTLNNLTTVYTALPVSNVFTAGDQLNYFYYGYTVVVQYVGSAFPGQKLYFKVVVVQP